MTDTRRGFFSLIKAFCAACLTITLSWSSLSSGQQPPDPPAPPWKDFIRMPGHSGPIPAQWVVTPAGRFAHSVKLPDSIPKTVPFDFSKARLKALAPNAASVARQYWEHLCETEAGSFILKTVKHVEGFAYLRVVPGTSEQELRDRWRAEAPRLQSDYAWRYDPLTEAVGYVNPPFGTYLYVEYPSAEKSGAFLRLSGYVSRKSPFQVTQVESPTSRYGVTWRGIHRPRDREFLISGHEWIVLDRSNDEVLAVFRDFAITGFTRNEKGGIFWLNAMRCPMRKAVFGRTTGTEEADWVPRVLAPTIYPESLRFIDQLKGVDK